MYYYIPLKRKDGEGKVKIWIENENILVNELDKIPGSQVIANEERVNEARAQVK